jgi:hypothetical protein
VLEFCEIGEQGGLVIDGGTCLYASGRKVDPRLWPYLNESSKGHAFEFIETNSGRGRAPAREPVPRSWDAREGVSG